MANLLKDTEACFARWPRWRRWFGARSERAAARFLHRLGYRSIACNYADRRGEIDLIMLDGMTIVIVEVRSSESKDLKTLAESVDREKQKRLTNAALRFLGKFRIKKINIRFDVLVIRWPARQKHPEIRHYQNAFESIGQFQFYS